MRPAFFFIAEQGFRVIYTLFLLPRAPGSLAPGMGWVTQKGKTMSEQKTGLKKPRVAVIVPPGTISCNGWRVALYFRALIRGGALPFALPLTQDEALLRFLLSDADGLLITGGCDIDPSFYGASPDPSVTYNSDFDRIGFFLCRSAIEMGMPVFGICRGMQLMNVVSGGTLHLDISGHKDGVTHPLKELSGTLGRILGTSGVIVNSFHHQAVDLIGDSFCVTAVSEDGFIEGIEDPDRPFVVGVQWHPERMSDPGTLALFEVFTRNCLQYAESPYKQNQPLEAEQ